MNALFRTIEFLRGAAQAPQSELPSYARAADDLPRVPVSEAGDCAAMLASTGRGLVRQMHRATPEALVALRDCAGRMADALECEHATYGARPWHLERD